MRKAGSRETQFLAGVDGVHEKADPSKQASLALYREAVFAVRRLLPITSKLRLRKAGSRETQFLAGVDGVHEKIAPSKQNIVLRYHREAVKRR